MQKGKQATRGQKQIHDENKSTVFHYSVASALTSGLYVVLNLLVFGSGGTGPWVNLRFWLFRPPITFFQ